MKIANAAGFWGDRISAAATLLKQQPDIDVITLDYLAEVSMSILAVQQAKDPTMGYAADFIEALKLIQWKPGLKIVTNAGGLNPKGCAEACKALFKDLKIAIVTGDNVLEALKKDSYNPLYANLESNEPLGSHTLTTANVYLGAFQIAEALRQGADIVVTGRVADPSLTVGPCIAQFGWKPTDFDSLAGATIAGHLIECGTQVTGGICTDWLNIPDPANIGYPIAEIAADGSCVITKPAGTGGRVDLTTVKEQLLYEIGDPSNYISPDVTVSFLKVKVEDLGDNRVRVTGAQGSPPPQTLKVSATYLEGYRAEAFLAFAGKDAVKKARFSGQIILHRAGYAFKDSNIECFGAGDLIPGHFAQPDAKECILRVSVQDPRKEAVESFTREIAPMVTSGAPGTTGYISGRPQIRPVFAFWPCLFFSPDLQPKVEFV